MNDAYVAAHVHSTWSYDGNWSLAEIAAAFGVLGFDAVLMAEHDRGFTEERWAKYVQACAATSNGPLLIPGLEYADIDDAVHVAVWGSDSFLGSGRPTQEVVAAAHSRDAIAVLAHPGRREAWKRAQDSEWLEALDGVELWNRRYDGGAPGEHAPALLRRCRGGIGFFSSDFHSLRDLCTLSMCVSVESPLSREQVIDALRRRRAQGMERPLFGERLRRAAIGIARKAHVLERFA